MKKSKFLNKAKKLREEGYSLKEISEVLGVSKSTASLWLRNIVISIKGKKRLSKLSELARRKGVEVKLLQRELYFQNIEKNCNIFVNKRIQDINIIDAKIYLALLFWGEGSKGERRLVFMNSDPDMIRVYLLLLRKSFKIRDDKLRAVLHLHSYHNKEELIEYWSRVTKIKKENIYVYKKSNTGKRKKENYKGCISLRYGDVRILDEILLIIKRFIKIINAGVG